VAAGLAATALAERAAADAVIQAAPASPFLGDDELGWLEPLGSRAGLQGTTCGVPWPKGALQPKTQLRVTGASGPIAAQTWPLAYWPDGSIKWLAVAMPPKATMASSYQLKPGTAAPATESVKVKSSDNAIEIDTGMMQCVVGRTGESMIRSIVRNGRNVLVDGHLTAMLQDAPADAVQVRRESFTSRIDGAVVEQDGPTRAVIKLSGFHVAIGTGAANRAAEAWLPFVVRLYFYAGSEVVRLMHTFVFDGDENKHFLCGLGVRFRVPLRDELHNRHVRFVGNGPGLFAEAVRGITGLRRDPGEEVRKAQLEGRATPPLESWPGNVRNSLQYVPAWGDYTLSQLSSEGFQIRKRTKNGHGWISSATGRRAAGVGFIGGATGGGVSFGMRDFWQKHPVGLDIRNAHTDVAQVTLWLYSPEAQPMDLRFYHDGMGQDTYAKQIQALDITYEDYEAGYGTPHGVARTSELYLRAEAATPTRDAQVAFADAVRLPPQLVVSPKRLLESGVFGAQWTLPDSSTPTKAWIETRLDSTLDAYIKEVDQRSWYGFWDYGDVMHSYDLDRHVWRYDVGGYAWDNSELSPDLWLWMSYCRTGRADVFRMAEAMTRHTGEVDVYHLGRFKGLGTRHSVQHWGDSSKQTRVSTAIYRRHYYFLTADERTGDLLREALFGVEAEKKINVGRKLGENRPMQPLPPVEDPRPGGLVGTDGMSFGNMVAAWMTEAERTNDPKWHQRIVNAMNGMARLPHGFFGSGILNLDTGEITPSPTGGPSQSHLRASFGLPEIAVELIRTYGDHAPKFADAWSQYGRLYNGTREQQQAELGTSFRNANLRDAHSRITAFAALHTNNAALAKRAWDELLDYHEQNGFTPPRPPQRVEGPLVLNPIDETPLGTNGSQWLLAAMECLAFLKSFPR
jgi:hypothetical protein